MREIFVKNNEIVYKENSNGREELSKSEPSLEHIQLDKDGLAKYLNEMYDRESKFISLSAKICGNSATYDIIIEKTEELSDTIPEISMVGEREEITSSINKTTIHIKEGVFVAITGRKLKPGDFFFEKVLINGEFVDLPVNVKKVINGIGNLYQIVTDEDGTWGYNI